jgi:hypothetical protein
MASEEVWSVNPVFDPTGEFPGGVDQTALESCALLIANTAIPNNMRIAMSSAVSRTGCRLEVRSDSDDSLIAIANIPSSTPMAGTTNTYLPPQTAVVCSVRTNTPGASGRGRLYWPAMGMIINATGRITTPTAGALVADFKTYLTGIRSALATSFPTIGFDLAVRSRTKRETPHAVRLQVGTVPDVQRRRRDNLTEVYASAVFP